MTEGSDFPNFQYDDGPLSRIRYRLGRWLLRPKTNAIFEHYTRVATTHHRNDDHERETRCKYIMIGARYVGYGK